LPNRCVLVWSKKLTSGQTDGESEDGDCDKMTSERHTWDCIGQSARQLGRRPGAAVASVAVMTEAAVIVFAHWWTSTTDAQCYSTLL